MLAILIIMYLWASATIFVASYAVDPTKFGGAILSGIFWPLIVPVIIVILVIELLNRGRY